MIITQKGGTVKNCFNAAKGGAYTLIKAKLVTAKDSRASNAEPAAIEYTAAVKGGAIYCENCILSLVDFKSEHTAAEFGGVIYAKDQATIELTSSSVKYSLAVKNGGFIYAIDEAATPPDSSITFKTSTHVMEDMKATENGGAFYILNTKFKTII